MSLVSENDIRNAIGWFYACRDKSPVVSQEITEVISTLGGHIEREISGLQKVINDEWQLFKGKECPASQMKKIMSGKHGSLNNLSSSDIYSYIVDGVETCANLKELLKMFEAIGGFKNNQYFIISYQLTDIHSRLNNYIGKDDIERLIDDIKNIMGHTGIDNLPSAFFNNKAWFSKVSHGFEDKYVGSIRDKSGRVKSSFIFSHIQTVESGICGDNLTSDDDFYIGCAAFSPILSLCNIKVGDSETLIENINTNLSDFSNTFSGHPKFCSQMRYLADLICEQTRDELETVPSTAKKVFRYIDDEDVVFVYSFDHRFNLFLNEAMFDDLYNKKYSFNAKKGRNYASNEIHKNAAVGIKASKVVFSCIPPTKRPERDTQPLYTQGALLNKFKRETSEVVEALYEFMEDNTDWYKDYYTKRVNFFIHEILADVLKLSKDLRENANDWVDKKECRLPAQEIIWMAPNSNKALDLLKENSYNIEAYVIDKFIIELILKFKTDGVVNSTDNKNRLTRKLKDHNDTIKNIVKGEL